MKKLFLTTAIVLAGLIVTAQNSSTNSTSTEEKPIHTLLNNNTSIGAWLGFSSGYTPIDNRDAFICGVNGGIILNHSLAIGLAGKGFACDSPFKNIASGQDAYLSGGYGGLYLEPVILPNEPVHLSIPIIIGAGGAVYTDEKNRDRHDNWNNHHGWNSENWDKEDWDRHTLDSDAFFVIEPGLQVEMNVVKFLRIGVGASYRWVYGLDLKNTKEDMLDGFSTNVSLKIGLF